MAVNLTTQATNRALRAAGAAFGLFDRVKHCTQVDGKPGIVTGVQFREGSICYLVSWSSSCESGHFAPELESVDVEEWIG